VEEAGQHKPEEKLANRNRKKKKNQPIDTDLEMTKMMKSGFKAIIIIMTNDLNEHKYNVRNENHKKNQVNF
jgi:hypothetical protein